MATIAAAARTPDEVRVALVRLAGSVIPARRVEWLGGVGTRDARRLACWPPGDLAATDLPGPSGSGRLVVPLNPGRSASLHLIGPGRQARSPRRLRRLEALCSIAVAAERGFFAPTRERDPSADPDPTLGPLGPTFFTAFLDFTHGQARRRREPLVVLEVEVDRLASIRDLFGDALAEAAVDRVARAIRGAVRSSDVVARLDPSRLGVILPNASAAAGLKVAGTVRAAIERDGVATVAMPTLTASLGVACYPDHAFDPATLHAAASATLTRAKALGHAQVAVAPARPGPTQCVG